MTVVADILPSVAGSFEKAAAAAMSDTLPVPYAVLMDPYQTPAELLPWLAAHHAVDLWYEDWSEARKREMIAHTAGRSKVHPGEVLPELKGTHLGALRYLSFVDAVVSVSVIWLYRFVVWVVVLCFTLLNHLSF